MRGPEYAIVIPTVGRPGLAEVLRSLLAPSEENAPREIVVVDDRPAAVEADPVPGTHLPGVRVLRTGGRGPATARQAGWHSCTAPWIVFLDDDVRPPPDWSARLSADLADLPQNVAGSQGRIVVPRPVGRRPTDNERNTIALEGARWITADLAVRRSALERIGGFDTRFPRAYREDTDLVLRLEEAGLGLVRGDRVCVHPAAKGRRGASLAAQRGNSDNALMRRLHGPRWRERVKEAPGALRSHMLTTSLLVLAVTAALTRRRSTALALGAAWTARTARLAAARILPGPADPVEWADMAFTSALVPPLAVWHRSAGELRHARSKRRSTVRAIVFDRDGTLVQDVPYNGDPDLVVPRDGAAKAIELARSHGLSVAVVTNQSGVGRRLITEDDVSAVHRRIDELLGEVDVWEVCVHREDEGCACRKPRPGMVFSAARRLGVSPAECAVVGDIGADVEAAAAAGARGVLVPTPRTRAAELRAAPEVEDGPFQAVARILGGVRP